MIITAVDGTIELKDQLRNYKYRGEALAHMNFFDFMLETYEDSMEVEDDDDRPVQTPLMKLQDIEAGEDHSVHEYHIKMKQERADV